MSVAPEYAPDVFIPERARTRRPAPTALAPTATAVKAATPKAATPKAATPKALRLVTAAGATVDVPVALLPTAPAPSRFAPINYLTAAPVSPFALPVRVAARPVTAVGTGDSASVARPARTPVRLTRRGVVALSLMAALLGLTLLVVAHLSLAATPTSSGSPRVVAGVVTVEPGDTLWSIAALVAPRRDPRLVVEQLRRVNSLDGVSLTPGQTLKVG